MVLFFFISLLERNRIRASPKMLNYSWNSAVTMLQSYCIPPFQGQICVESALLVMHHISLQEKPLQNAGFLTCNWVMSYDIFPLAWESEHIFHTTDDPVWQPCLPARTLSYPQSARRVALVWVGDTEVSKISLQPTAPLSCAEQLRRKKTVANHYPHPRPPPFPFLFAPSHLLPLIKKSLREPACILMHC